MMKKPPKPPDWPKARRWLALEHPAWLIMEPARLAPVGAALFALLALLFYVLRQFQGVSMAVGDVVVGVALTFVVAYAATGIFVYYVLRLAEHERPVEEPEPEESEPSETEAGPGGEEPLG